MELTLAGIRRYPVKSFRGEDLASAVVERCGLAGDRRWMVVDDTGRFLTARDLPAMLLVDPEITGDGLILRAPGLPELELPRPDGTTLAEVSVWSSTLVASPAVEADAWVSRAIGRPARLVYLDDPLRRATNPARTEPDDRVSFADGYPLLAVTEESWERVNELIADGPRPEEGPIPITRFRPNVVIRGEAAWREDGWRRIRIGAATFRAVQGCARCVLTTIDPDTAAKGKEPVTTLARHRRWDGQVWFGMNLVPDTIGATITVGDEVEILDAVDDPDGPPR